MDEEDAGGAASSGSADEEVDETADGIDDPADEAAAADADADAAAGAAAGAADASKAHLRAAKKTVQSLKSKIAEVKNYRVAPGKDSVRVLKATLYFLKYNRAQFHDGKKVSKEVWASSLARSRKHTKHTHQTTHAVRLGKARTDVLFSSCLLYTSPSPRDRG